MFWYNIVVSRKGCAFCWCGFRNNRSLHHQTTRYVRFTHVRYDKRYSSLNNERNQVAFIPLAVEDTWSETCVPVRCLTHLVFGLDVASKTRKINFKVCHPVVLFVTKSSQNPSKHNLSPFIILNYMFRPISGHPQVHTFCLKHIEEEVCHIPSSKCFKHKLWK
jgi:hypothetical protein